MPKHDPIMNCSFVQSFYAYPKMIVSHFAGPRREKELCNACGVRISRHNKKQKRRNASQTNQSRGEFFYMNACMHTLTKHLHAFKFLGIVIVILIDYFINFAGSKGIRKKKISSGSPPPQMAMVSFLYCAHSCCINHLCTHWMKIFPIHQLDDYSSTCAAEDPRCSA